MTINKTEKIHPSNGMVIRYKGLIDMDSLYKNVKLWFIKNKYDYFEKENTEKHKDVGINIKIRMKAQREIDDYVRFDLEVDMVEVLHYKKVEGGYYGEPRIVIRGFMILDYRNNWKLIPFLFYLYNNIILKNKILKYYWPKIFNEMMDLNDLIKKELGLIK